jgi:hypothetical protein
VQRADMRGALQAARNIRLVPYKTANTAMNN